MNVEPADGEFGGGRHELPVTVEDWDSISDWWRSEVIHDPVYREDVAPMLLQLMPREAGPALELGCGEGQWLRWLGPDTFGIFGCDRSGALLRDASATHAVAVCELPDLGWLKDGSIRTAFSVFVFDLIEDIDVVFAEARRVVAPAGLLVVIINHPAFTAPGSGPFMDADRDVFWRWGDYLERGSSRVPAGSGAVEMHHRSTGDILTSAARAGWQLEEMIEAPLGAAAIEREPSYEGQEKIPRFLGLRWRR